MARASSRSQTFSFYRFLPLLHPLGPILRSSAKAASLTGSKDDSGGFDLEEILTHILKDLAWGLEQASGGRGLRTCCPSRVLLGSGQGSLQGAQEQDCSLAFKATGHHYICGGAQALMA